MGFLNSYNNVWSVIESVVTVLTLSFTAFLFLNDPIRRWKFLGFRPTVIIVLFDPKLKKILLIKSVEWCFNQGSIYTQDITQTIENTLQRELNIGTGHYRIYLVNPLGKIGIQRKKRIKRIALGSISLFPNLKGKGYIGCFLDTNLTKLKKQIKLGYGIEDFGIYSVKEAKKMLNTFPSTDNPHKQKIYTKLFKTLDNLLTNWNQRSRSL